MHTHHSDQYKLVAALRACDVSLAPRETSDQHHDITIQLWNVVHEWNSQFRILSPTRERIHPSTQQLVEAKHHPIESNLKREGIFAC
ncbi:hypothetical protein HPP92_016594 [Vanilla planifolia]|uniref:DUF632 domain-containing protein n=1 Tax=Vanilla planifolia TaxID=51239 RepID=A0A835QFH9_VANPL|nr:hypothetical protein HPP92_017188 [Vanilla planifolia]KAG0472048.1 hypothetical protein HPP92_016594 [Vanilla planifolia]